MPVVKTKSADIYYEEYGSGIPVIGIMGFGGTTLSWKPVVPFFEKYMRFIIYDNRGAGKTVMHDKNVSLEQMAEDVFNLLDALNINSPINVIGFSMGGLITQVLAHYYPDNIKTMILGCTGPGAGDPNFIQAEPYVQDKIFNPGDTDEEYVKNFISIYYGEEFISNNPGLYDMMLEYRKNRENKYHLYQEQLAAAISPLPFVKWMKDIDKPVLILHGTHDKIFKPENAKITNENIKNSKLVWFENAGHMFFIEKMKKFLFEVENFIKKHN